MTLPGAARRLAGMSAREMRTRARQESGKWRDVLLQRVHVDPFSLRGSDLDMRGRFYCDAAQTPQVTEVLRTRMPEAADSLVERAGRIVDRRFDLLGFDGLDFGHQPDWGLDPVHGVRAPSRPWPQVPYLDFSVVGDHKIIWELSRCQFLMTLARAYRLTGEERFATALTELFHQWLEENPYPVGMNWTSTLEVAFRAIAWTWTSFLLEGTPAATPLLQRRLTAAIARSGWFLSRFLSTYFSPNTHLLGEGAALFLIGVRYPGLRQAAKWRETGWRIVLEAARTQVRDDGFYFEQSTHYHVYALDFFLHSRTLAARNGVEVPAELDRTIRNMLAALAAISQAFAAPRFGDDDGGRLFDGARCRATHLRDPLSTGAALYGSSAFKSVSPGVIEEMLWLLGPESAAAFDAVEASAPPYCSVALPASGIYALTSPAPAVAQLIVDSGPQGALSAGHGHADALSLQLAAGGRLWLGDLGTCHYLGGGGAREWFRGTAAHNTLTVDGLSQAESAGPFSWAVLPRVETLGWVAGGSFDFWSGRHHGYERLAEPVTHTRTVLRWGSGWWLVRDAVTGSGKHRLDLAWHFAPGLALSTRWPAVIAAQEDAALTLSAAPSPGWKLSVSEEEYSPAYGARTPASVAHWSASVECPAELATSIALGDAAATLIRVDSHVQGAVAYEYRAGIEIRWVYFATGAGPWRAGEWESDAAMLGYRIAPNGDRELILAGGSWADYDCRRAVEAPTPLARIECRMEGGEWVVASPGTITVHAEALP
jgi:hypothetical protein